MHKQPIDLNGKTILVTGAAGFIGAHLVQRLLQEMDSGTVISVDNLNDYYDVSLKEWRLSMIEKAASESSAGHLFVKESISNKAFLDDLFSGYHFDIVVNLAAQAGVRYSIDNPELYLESDIIGFYNLLEACRHSYDEQIDGYRGVQHLVYASSSSVYGGNTKVPFNTEDRTDTPLSFYAAAKKSNELFAHAYSKLYNIPCTGLRFFTVYGPAGRPDMFYFSAARALLNDQKIHIYNNGNCSRDFTYIDDIVEGIYRVMHGAPIREDGGDGLPVPPYAVYNIGGGRPQNLLHFIDVLEKALVDKKVLPDDFDFEGHHSYVGMQPGDMETTYADVTELERDYGFVPETGIVEGLSKFAEWFKEYY